MARLAAAGFGVVGEVLVLDTGEGGVEVVIVDEEGVMLGLGLVNGHVVQGHCVAQADRYEWPELVTDWEAEDVGEEPGGGVLVAGPNDGVVELDGH